MTKPRRLPNNVAHHTEDAIALVLDIQDWTVPLDDLIARGRTDEARHLVERIRRKARKAQDILRAMRDGSPLPDRDVLEQVGDMWGEDGEA